VIVGHDALAVEGVGDRDKNRTSAAVASLRAAPCPANTTGRFAVRRISAARAT